jgi:hypothetical protein
VDNELPSEGTEVKETANGDYIITHKGKHYPIKRENIDMYGIAYLGYLIMSQNATVTQEVEGPRIAYIYHNAEDANETCLGREESVKAQR